MTSSKIANQITYRQVVQSLEQAGLLYRHLWLQNGAVALVTGRGGRILGPFPARGDSPVVSNLDSRSVFRTFGLIRNIIITTLVAEGFAASGASLLKIYV